MSVKTESDEREALELADKLLDQIIEEARRQPRKRASLQKLETLGSDGDTDEEAPDTLRCPSPV